MGTQSSAHCAFQRIRQSGWEIWAVFAVHPRINEYRIRRLDESFIYLIMPFRRLSDRMHQRGQSFTDSGACHILFRMPRDDCLQLLANVCRKLGKTSDSWSRLPARSSARPRLRLPGVRRTKQGTQLLSTVFGAPSHGGGVHLGNLQLNDRLVPRPLEHLDDLLESFGRALSTCEGRAEIPSTTARKRTNTTNSSAEDQTLHSAATFR